VNLSCEHSADHARQLHRFHLARHSGVPHSYPAEHIRTGSMYRLIPMIHPRLRLWTAAFVLMLGCVTAPSAVAADGIQVIESGATYSFAQQATFTLQAVSDTEITQVYLFFQAVSDERVQSVDVGAEQGQEISVKHVHDLRQDPLPPLATVTFWWQIENAAGVSLTTEREQFKYEDNRFQWQQLSAEGITVHWIEGRGDPAFGQAALDIAQQSEREINTEFQAPMPASIDIYVYDAQHNLDAAMVLTGRDWITGLAHPEMDGILIAIPPEEGYTSRMKRYIPHEITHLLVYQAVTPDGYRYVPEWLDEGLATANEQLPTPEYTLAIEEARAQGELLSLEALCVPFSPDSSTAFLSYAQSGSVVRFIRERYGARGIRALLDAYANGASCGSGVQEALSISLHGLETAWRASLEPQTRWQALFEQIGVWVGLWLLSLLVALPMIGGRQRRQ
jgi:hypothetical protein